jgi:hypothetical protein
MQSQREDSNKNDNRNMVHTIVLKYLLLLMAMVLTFGGDKTQKEPLHTQTHQWHQHAGRSCHGCEHSVKFFVSGVGDQTPGPVSQNLSASPEKDCPHLHR